MQSPSTRVGYAQDDPVAAPTVSIIPIQQFRLLDDTRLERDQDHINALADDFRRRLKAHPDEHPVQNPLRGFWRDGWMDIVAGGNRFLAGLQIPLPNLPCSVLPRELSADEMFVEQYRDNKLHKEYSPIEDAQALVRVMAARACSQSEAARLLGISQTEATKRLRVLRDYPEDLWPLIGEGDGKVPFSSAYAIARLTDEATKREFTRKVQCGLMIRDSVGDEVSKILEGAGKKPRPQRPVKARDGGVAVQLPGSWGWADLGTFGKRLCELATRGEKNELPFQSLPQLLRRADAK